MSDKFRLCADIGSEQLLDVIGSTDFEKQRL